MAEENEEEPPVITAIVLFKVPATLARDEAARLFEQSAPRYRGMAGLVRKYYLFDGKGQAGGAYLWQSREDAERAYSPEWRQTIAARYGAAPEITFFETPVIVDNSQLAGDSALAAQ
jgi:hypothetical protein